MQAQKKIVIFTLIVGVCLMLFKFLAYLITGSNAILTDAAESIVNVLASSFAFYSIYLAAQPKDQNHPYGHGKVEFFAVFVEGSLIIIAALFIIFKSVYNLYYPQKLHLLLNGAIIIVITTFVNGALGWYLLSASKKLNSLTLHAEGKHLLSDTYSSFGLFAGLIIIHFTRILWLDSAISIALGLYILFSGYRLLRKSVGGLMDESDSELISKVVNALNEYRKTTWIDVHNLKTQRYGHSSHIDCHLTLPYYYDLNKVHEEVTTLDKLISSKLGDDTEFFVHADPCLPACCHYCRISDCPVRQQEKNTDIRWTTENITQNYKHFQTR